MQYIYLCTGGFIKHAIYLLMYSMIDKTCNICIYVQYDSCVIYLYLRTYLCTEEFIKHAIYAFV